MKDKQGNEIIRRYTKKGTDYLLVLDKEQYPRKLGSRTDKGHPYFENGIFHMRRHPEKHYHYKVQGYGFNNELIYNILERNTPIVLSIMITKQKFLLTPQFIIDNAAAHLMFLPEWFEKQVFVEFDIIKNNLITKSRPMEKIRSELQKTPNTPQPLNVEKDYEIRWKFHSKVEVEKFTNELFDFWKKRDEENKNSSSIIIIGRDNILPWDEASSG